MVLKQLHFDKRVVKAQAGMIANMYPVAGLK